ncbi:MAG TPA: redoxin domain-containing protein [Fodinibius sp.]|nr:redoxin domain-containing protein [Fodinibius sp.]
MSLIPELNSPAADFALQNTKGEEISLDELKSGKKIVLVFFPLAFSPASTEGLRVIRDNMKLYNALDAKVIGISVDSFFTLRAFKKSENINFTLLSDFNREVSRDYGVLSDDFSGMKDVARRAVFVIDREGIIRYKEVIKDLGITYDFRSLQQALSSI